MSHDPRSQTLPVVVFSVLVLFVVLQASGDCGSRALWWRTLCAQVMVRPYGNARDNALELCCLLLLMWSYFASVIVGTTHSDAIGLCALVAKALLIAYAAGRAALRTLASWVAEGHIKETEQREMVAPLDGTLDSPLLEPHTVAW